jgi:hypothetical protein
MRGRGSGYGDNFSAAPSRGFKFHPTSIHADEGLL